MYVLQVIAQPQYFYPEQQDYPGWADLSGAYRFSSKPVAKAIIKNIKEPMALQEVREVSPGVFELLD